MKNILLGTITLSVLFATSCTKQNTVPITDSWTMGGTAHTVKDTQSFSKGAPSYMAKDVDGNSIYFYFRSLPSMNGVYRVVHNQNPLSNQVLISTQSIGQSAYQSIGDDSTDAVITVSGNNINISVPNVWMGNVNMLINDSTWKPTDSTVLSASASFINHNIVPPTSTGGTGFWNIGEYRRNMLAINKQDFLNSGGTADSSVVTISDDLSNTVELWFKKFPTAAGQYKVVSGGLTNDNDIRIVSKLFWGTIYKSTGDGRKVTVTSFADGVGISIPHTWMTSGSDSVIFSSVLMKR